MKATISKNLTTFKPHVLIINIDTAQDLEILHRLFNAEKNRQAEYINSMYAEHAKIKADVIDHTLKPIYEAIQDIRAL